MESSNAPAARLRRVLSPLRYESAPAGRAERLRGGEVIANASFGSSGEGDVEDWGEAS